jgi:RNA polymerase sigma factor (sigma-70 family)
MDVNAKQNEKTEVTALIKRAMDGDDSVWGEVYEKTHRYVYFIARKTLRNEQDAEDITHDVYIQIIRSIKELYSADSFYGWLRRIIFSKCTDLMKKKKPVLAEDAEVVETSIEVDEAFLPDMVLDSAETRRMVMELIDALPDAQRQSVLFYYYDEMTIDQIAALMECSAGTLKSRLNYARAKIKAGVEEHERKGIKLYGVAALPVLAILLREQAMAMEIPSALGASLAPILSGTPSAIGTNAAMSAGTAAIKTTTVFSSKLIAGIIAAAVVVVGGIASLVLTLNKPPVAETPSGYESESLDATSPATEVQTEATEAEITVPGDSIVPETIAAHMDNLYNALQNGDIELTYSLMRDGDVHEWFISLDHKSEIFYIADSGQTTVMERETEPNSDYRDRFQYNKSAGKVAEPYFSIEFVQIQNDPGQLVMMVMYGKRENGFTYHVANIHYHNGEAIQFGWCPKLN